MLSEREINKIKREMVGLTYYVIETEILAELVAFWEKYHPAKGKILPPPPPNDDPGYTQ